MEDSWLMEGKDGVVLGQRIRPMKRVGLYVPGGAGIYPSTVIMNAVPAIVAGVKDIVVVTPIKGEINRAVAFVLCELGITEVYHIGGAQAIGMLAYGAKDGKGKVVVERVDKIVGPGNVFAAVAKKEVFGIVDIDMVAGPSEVLVLADNTCDPDFVAAMIDSTKVENCTIEGVEIKGTDRVGGLVGEAKNVTVTNVSVAGTVSGTNNVGGILGSVQNGTLTNLTNSASVSGNSTVGGVVGGSSSVGEQSSISMAINNGTVSGTKDVGGVVATLSSTKLEKAGNYGAVTADESQLSNAGGVVAVASNKSVVNEVFNTGAVTVKKVMAVGGVIGSLKAVTATNLFNLGEVSGQASNIGGLVGIVDGSANLESAYNAGKVPDSNLSGTVAGKVTAAATVSNVYYDKTVGGSCLVVASQMGMELPTGFATEEMKAASFVATLNGAGAAWTIDPTKFNGYPAFAWIK